MSPEVKVHRAGRAGQVRQVEGDVSVDRAMRKACGLWAQETAESDRGRGSSPRGEAQREGGRALRMKIQPANPRGRARQLLPRVTLRPETRIPRAMFLCGICQLNIYSAQGQSI